MNASPLKQASLVIALAIAFALMLAGIQLALRDRIAQNKCAETLTQIPLLLPGADLKKTRSLRATLDGKPLTVDQAFDPQGRLLGYVVPASGAGFNDQIELLIAYDPQLKTLRGLYVLDQKETPGLGDNIARPAFAARFAGKTPGALQAVQPGFARAQSEIDAVSGATVSSQSVCDIVNRISKGLRIQGETP